MVNNINGIVRQ